MQNPSQTITRPDIFKIGIYQIIGGVAGAAMIAYSIIGSTDLTGLTILLYSFMLVFFAYSVMCGIMCVKYEKKALQYSFVNQVLQLVGFAFFGYSFNYVAGAYFTVGLDLSQSIEMSFGIGISKFNFSFNGDAAKAEIDFNLVAFIFVYWIDKLIKEIKAAKQQEEIDMLASEKMN